VSLGLAGCTNARVARCSTHSTKAAAAAAASNGASSSSTTTLPKIAHSSSSSDVLEESHSSSISTAAAAASIDPRLESSVEWLLKHVTDNYTHLQRRVTADVADMEAQFEAQKVSSQYFKFFKNKFRLACATLWRVIVQTTQSLHSTERLSSLC
jgi:hypothetical protein